MRSAAPLPPRQQPPRRRRARRQGQARQPAVGWGPKSQSVGVQNHNLSGTNSQSVYPFRQVGKSTLVADLATSDHPTRFISLDDEATANAARADPTGLIAAISGPAVIDEIQRAPGLLLAIKQRLDSDRSGEIVGVEVKASATPAARDFAGLRYLRDKLGARFKAGVVLQTGADTLPFGDRLAAVPMSGLWS